MCSAVLPAPWPSGWVLVKSDCPQMPHMNDGGSIVNASSILGLQGMAKCGAYVASKHAVIVRPQEWYFRQRSILTPSPGLDKDGSKGIGRAENTV